MDCILLGSSIHGIFLARVLEWVAFHAKMGTIKDRNGVDLTEAKDTKRWQEYTEALHEKDLHDPDNHDGVSTHI